MPMSTRLSEQIADIVDDAISEGVEPREFIGALQSFWGDAIRDKARKADKQLATMLEVIRAEA